MLPASVDNTHSSPSPWEQLCRRFSLAEIRSATQNFDDALVIGQGGFGKVYRGNINDGSSMSSIAAAIKRLDSRSKQGASEFWAEVEMLSKLRHCHLVSLIGYCNEFDEMILVYEFMPHGTLGDHLHIVGTRLSWLQRLKICIGAARGLDYLHTGSGTRHGVIHRDVKTSNILLDDNWEAKISDFGLSRVGPKNQPSTFVSTAVKGTFGYVDPEYFLTGRLTRKSDVYAFGVVLLEVLCGRRAVDRSLDEEQWGLAGWAQDCIKEGKLEHIIDSSLRGQILLNCLKEFAQIAEWCLRSRPDERPTMAEVVVRLELALALQETPDYGPGYSATPARKITFTRKILKFFFPCLGPSRKSGKNEEGTSYNKFLNKDLEVNKEGNVSQEVQQSAQIVTLNLKVFTLAELKEITRNFNPSRLLGEGSSGLVFKGWVDENTYAPSKVSGMPVAIKKGQTNSGLGQAEWQAEVNFLGQFGHPNIIHLLGYCMDNQEYLLVYEFMKNGSLDKYLFSRRYLNPLPWAVRLKIMIGAAEGLAFLHTMDNQVIHRNFKSSSILLDGDYNPKLSGFGLAKFGPVSDGSQSHVSTRVMGTSGYAAPEYVLTGHLSVKSDVYGFGVVLLEVLTGRRVLDGSRPGTERNLVEWAKPKLSNKRKVMLIMDTRLEGQYPVRGAIQAASLVQECLRSAPKDRPSMKEVLQTLEEINAFKFQPENTMRQNERL